jgi:hypothetical protein|tara:strand:+ start:6899 stop:7048 length:150 start_codon:yes stop_codon:yes gene_type:complete
LGFVPLSRNEEFVCQGEKLDEPEKQNSKKSTHTYEQANKQGGTGTATEV